MHWKLRPLIPLGFCYGLVACGATEPKDDSRVRQLLASIETVASIASVGVAPYDGLVPVVPVSRNCSYDGASQTFVCAEFVSGGLTVRRKYQLLDASGNPQPAFDEGTTHALRAITNLSGTIARPGSTPLKVSGQIDATLSGLRETTFVLNGAGDFGERETLHVGLSILGLRLPAPGSTNGYPRSGSIDLDVFDIVDVYTLPQVPHIQMTFDGSSIVAMAWHDGHTNHSCTFDLANLSKPPVCT